MCYSLWCSWPNIMYYAHIINLSSGHIIQEIAKDKTNIVSLFQAVVQAIQSSGKCQDAFQDLIRDGNVKGWFQAGQPPKPIKVKQLELLWHIHTWWDSFYHMLNRLCEMHPVLSVVFINLLLLITWTGCWQFSLLSSTQRSDKFRPMNCANCLNRSHIKFNKSCHLRKFQFC